LGSEAAVERACLGFRLGCTHFDGAASVADTDRLAFDRSLPPSESLCRIRDACRNYDRKGGIE
jgi:hypothetical protein